MVFEPIDGSEFAADASVVFEPIDGSEFAGDASFGYSSSNLAAWVELITNNHRHDELQAWLREAYHLREMSHKD